MVDLAEKVTLRQFVVFRAVATELSFSRAALRLNTSQSTVSYALSQLEQALGVRLLSRSPSFVALTPDGHGFLAQVERLLDVLEEAGQMLPHSGGTLWGTVRFGTGPTIGTYVMPPLLAAFGQKAPHVLVEMEIADVSQVVNRLQSGRYQIAIAGPTPNEESLVKLPFLRNEVVIVARPQHPLVGEKSIPLTRLAAEKFIVREPGSGVRRILDRLFDAEGLRIRIAMELSYAEAVQSAVEHGLGISITPRISVAAQLETGRLSILDVQGFPILSRWDILVKQARQLSKPAQAFKDFLVSKAAEAVTGLEQQLDKQDAKTRTL